MIDQLTVLTYLLYLVIAVPLTVWVGRTLFKNGAMFLVDVFHGNAELAAAVNKLLIVAFYLLNGGFVALYLQGDETVKDLRGVIEQLSVKIGIVMLVLGVLHLCNVYVFNALRRRSLAFDAAVPPVEVSARLRPPAIG